MQEEKSPIIEKFAQSESFKVPEGYFESFAQNFEQEHLPAAPTAWHKMRKWAYAAAVFGVILLSGFGLVYLQDRLEEKNMEYLSAENYIDTQVEELNEEDLIDAILASNDN